MSAETPCQLTPTVVVDCVDCGVQCTSIVSIVRPFSGIQVPLLTQDVVCLRVRVLSGGQGNSGDAEINRGWTTEIFDRHLFRVAGSLLGAVPRK